MVKLVFVVKDKYQTGGVGVVHREPGKGYMDYIMRTGKQNELN
jgi:hypothetical protein